jgi:hypothetical protein
MANRFDRFIANPESLALPQCYDEYLTGDELTCLIEGCGWSGKALSMHMNMSHGIPKKKFKEMAGFNASTGVIPTAYSERLSQAKIDQGWSAEHMKHLRSLVKNRKFHRDGTQRLEGKEHLRKSQALSRAERNIRTVCEGCQTVFLTGEMHKKFCTIECRTQYYSEVQKKQRQANKRHILTCSTCQKTFLGDDEQQNRVNQNLAVACSYYCRQKRAGHIARGTWTGK